MEANSSGATTAGKHSNSVWDQDQTIISNTPSDEHWFRLAHGGVEWKIEQKAFSKWITVTPRNSAQHWEPPIGRLVPTDPGSNPGRLGEFRITIPCRLGNKIHTEMKKKKWTESSRFHSVDVPSHYSQFEERCCWLCLRLFNISSHLAIENPVHQIVFFGGSISTQ